MRNSALSRCRARKVDHDGGRDSTDVYDLAGYIGAPGDVVAGDWEDEVVGARLGVECCHGDDVGCVIWVLGAEADEGVNWVVDLSRCN